MQFGKVIAHCCQCALAVTLVVSVASCVPTPTPTPEPTPTPTATATATPTPLPTPTSTPTPAPVLFLWHSLPPEQEAQLQNEIDRFQAGYRKVQVVLKKYQDTPTLEQELAEGSHEADLVLGNARAIGFMRDRQLLQPVDGLFDSTFLQDLALPGLEGVTHDDHLWGIPHTLGMQLLLFYNARMIAAPPADTTSLIGMALQWTDEERYGLGMNALDPLWLVPWLAAYGGWPTDAQGRPTVNAEAMTQALTFLHSLAWEHKIMNGMADYDAGLEAFKAGHTAMWIDGEWVLNELGSMKDMEWGVALLPILADTGLEPACLIAGKYFAFGRHLEGDKLEAAQHLVQQLVGPEGAARWTEVFHTLPSSLTVLNGDIVQRDAFMRISAAQALAGRGVGLSSGMQQAIEIMRGPLEDVMFDRVSPKEAVRGMKARLEAMASPQP